MEGREFRQLAAEKPEVLRTLIPKLKVLARSSPPCFPAFSHTNIPTSSLFASSLVFGPSFKE